MDRDKYEREQLLSKQEYLPPSGSSGERKEKRALSRCQLKKKNPLLKYTTFETGFLKRLMEKQGSSEIVALRFLQAQDDLAEGEG